eukprot:94199-Amphidinium_carterae.1
MPEGVAAASCLFREWVEPLPLFRERWTARMGAKSSGGPGFHEIYNGEKHRLVCKESRTKVNTSTTSGFPMENNTSCVQAADTFSTYSRGSCSSDMPFEVLGELLKSGLWARAA